MENQNEETNKIIEKVTKSEEQQPAKKSKIDLANEAAERIEAANAKHEELLKREEALFVEKALSGKAEAGQQLEPPKEETAEDYKNKVMKGEE